MLEKEVFNDEWNLIDELADEQTKERFEMDDILSVSALSGINPPIKLPMINVLSLRDEKGKKCE